MTRPAAGRWPHVEWRMPVTSNARRRLAMLETAWLASLIRCGLLHRDTHLTNLSKFDGGGSQVHQALSVQAFAAAFDVPYAHTPFSAMAHTPEPEMIARWERLFRLGHGHPEAGRLDLEVIPLAAYLRSPAGYRRPCILSGLNVHAFVNANPGAYELVRDRARRLFGGVPPSRTDGSVRVAVHVRRGDVGAGSIRFTPSADIVRRMAIVRSAVERCGARAEVTVYSEGEPRAFREFVDAGASLRLDGDPLDTLNDLAHADVLMMAKSSFSYVAGLLNRRIVLYDPFWNAPLADWIAPPWADAACGARLAATLGSRLSAGLR